MTVTIAIRVDATHPVLGQLVDAAGKAFTGALEVTTTDSAGRDLQVSVWLEDGLIVAVHGTGFPVPAAACVAHVTGYDFGNGVDAFAAAQQTEADGRPALGQDDIYAAQLDWAHGLLASPLTWPRPRVARVKKATTTTDRIKPARIRVPRIGPGRPRTRPERVIADKGYPSKANRAWLLEPLRVSCRLHAGCGSGWRAVIAA